MSLILLLAIGLGAGFAGSLLGLGGGLIIVPGLALLLEVPIHQAIAASLVGAVATSCGAAPSNLRRGYVNVRVSGIFEMFAIAGAIAGGLLGTITGASLLSRIFGVTMIVMSILMFRRPRVESSAADPQRGESSLLGSYYDEAEGGMIRYAPRRVPAGMGISTGAGVLSGLLGIGGGIVQVPMMALINGLPMKAATSTSNYMLGVTAVAGALVYYGQGFLQPVTAAGVVLGVLAGSRLGAVVNRRVRSDSLQLAFGIVMIGVGVRMVIG